MKFEIKSRWNGSVLFSVEAATLKVAVEAAIKSGSDLSGSNLRGCDLRGSDLRGCDLRGSDLRDSDLRDSNLRGSDLSGSDLRGSDLRGCNLSDSDLSGSDLRDSNLSGCNLRGSDLRGCDLSDSDLRGSNLRGCDLEPIRDDLWAVLSSAPAEAVGLRAAIAEGRIDGSTYEGECACLVGTLANVRHCRYDAIQALKPNSSRPIERFFLGIRKGDTPDTSEFSKLVLEWTDEWLERMTAAFAAKTA